MQFTLTSVLALLLLSVASAAPTAGSRLVVRGCDQESDGEVFGDNAITLEEANTGDFEPGTPVVDAALNLNEGESCTTTSTQGVLGCGDGTGGNFNIVDGERRS
ncbi:hypothetical protein PG997_008590 [Apiospora hydei]|uniref:Uncharacterized protein n=1 Tax=Apiospora hydei TaxID=1337664 RepID=A0ABR1WBH7_9PEZI